MPVQVIRHQLALLLPAFFALPAMTDAVPAIAARAAQMRFTAPFNNVSALIRTSEAAHTKTLKALQSSCVLRCDSNYTNTVIWSPSLQGIDARRKSWQACFTQRKAHTQTLHPSSPTGRQRRQTLCERSAALPRQRALMRIPKRLTTAQGPEDPNGMCVNNAIGPITSCDHASIRQLQIRTMTNTTAISCHLHS